MTNRIAFVLAGLIVALLLVDAAVLHLGLPVRIGKLFDDLVEWLSFWR